MIDLRWLSAVAMLTLAAPAAADCTANPARTVLGETNRIRDCLQDIARQPYSSASSPIGYSERRLYTWGPDTKISRMLDDPHFCHYEYARQEEFELKKTYSDALATTSHWYGHGGARTLPGVDALDVRRDFKRGLSLQFVLPGMHERSTTLEARRQQVVAAAEALEGSAPSPDRSAALGRLAAHNMAAGARESSIKGGRGVYFSADPFRYFVANERDFALVCPLPLTVRAIIALPEETTQQALTAQNILYNETLALAGTTMVPFIQNPRLFDAAARGNYIVRMIEYVPPDRPAERAYVDKCAITYQACRRLTLAPDALSCADFERLIGLRRNTDADGFVPVESPTPLRAEMYDYFARQADFATQFQARLSQCLGSADLDAIKAAMRGVGRQALADALP